MALFVLFVDWLNFTEHNVLEAYPRCSLCARISFLFKAESYSIAWGDHILFTHSFVEGHLCCFRSLAGVRNTAVTMDVPTPLGDPAFTSCGCLLRSRIARSYGNSICSFLRNCQALSHSGSTISPSYQQCKGSNFSTSSPTVVSFSTVSILMTVRWYLLVDLTCISLMTSDAEPLLVRFLVICTSSSEKSL